MGSGFRGYPILRAELLGLLDSTRARNTSLRSEHDLLHCPSDDCVGIGFNQHASRVHGSSSPGPCRQEVDGIDGKASLDHASDGTSCFLEVLVLPVQFVHHMAVHDGVAILRNQGGLSVLGSHLPPGAIPRCLELHCVHATAMPYDASGAEKFIECTTVVLGKQSGRDIGRERRRGGRRQLGSQARRRGCLDSCMYRGSVHGIHWDTTELQCPL